MECPPEQDPSWEVQPQPRPVRCGAAGQCTPPSAGPTVTNPAPAGWLPHSSHHHQPALATLATSTLSHSTLGTLGTCRSCGEDIVRDYLPVEPHCPPCPGCWLLVCPRCGGVWLGARISSGAAAVSAPGWAAGGRRPVQYNCCPPARLRQGDTADTRRFGTESSASSSSAALGS